MVTLTEKYRPKKLSDCVLPKRIEKVLTRLLKKRDTGHLIFYGKPGIGKTATANALIHELCPNNNLVINASIDNSVDFMGTYLIKAMTSLALYPNEKKIIFLDEADGLTERAQESLRVPLEKFHHNVSVIFSFNDEKKIIPAIKSRCLNLCFDADADEDEEIIEGLFKRYKEIAKKEKIKISHAELKEEIEDYYPDYRKILKIIETY